MVLSSLVMFVASEKLPFLACKHFSKDKHTIPALIFYTFVDASFMHNELMHYRVTNQQFASSLAGW